MAKATKIMRDVLVRMSQGKRPECSWATWRMLENAELVVVCASMSDDGSRLTDAGLALAKLEMERQAAARTRRRESARGRAEEMRSIGLIKTPYGWE